MGEAFLEIDRARIARPSEDEHDHRLEILKASPDFILESLVRTVRDPQARIGMEKPVGAVAFHCNSFLRYSNTIHLDLVGAIKAMEEAINEAPVVGGYFDGEIGVDHDGHSMLANWSGSALTLADEVKTRALLPRAFVAFKKHGSALDRSESPEEAIEAALAMIRDLGYPGGIVWVLMKDGDHDILVPQDGYGGAWGALHREPCLMGKKDRPATEYPAVLLEDGSVLKQEPRYFPNLSPCHEALMSQYLAPLWSGRETSAGPANENQFLGLLQIDLGDTHLSAALRATEAEVLDFVATTTANSLARVFTWKEAQIMRKLDAGRDRAFRADSVDQGRQVLIETAVEAFGAQGGYIRIMTSGGLKAVAGIGTYFEAIANHRLQVKGTDPGPTGQVWNDQRSRILNQAQKDASVQNLVHRLMSRDQLTTAHTLQQIGSMGIAHIPGFGDTQPGNLVIQFRDPCRFHRHHVRCLDALALRIGLVAAYIETRVAADFLFRMRLDLPADLAAAGTGRGIQHLVENFRAAAKAQVASLCLWDKSLDKFVLYAQAGWSDASWVNVALYALQDLTGRIGFIETGPVYGPLEDLRRDLDIHGTDPYEKDMFGPSRQGEVLVLGISFRRDTEPLGVLTVFWVGERENNPFGHREGLSPANAKLFSRCAGLVGDYVNARLARRAERLNSEAIRRCKQIGRAADELVAQFAAEDSVDARHAFRFGSSLCELIGENYGASGVFLLAPTDDALECVGSWPPGRPEPAHPDHRSLTDRGYLVEMNQIVPDWRHDLEIAARFGSLLTVSIAVPLEGNRKGILHLVWDEKHLPRRSEYVLKASSLEAEVQLLADTIGWAYHRGAVRQSRQQDLHRAEKRTAQLGKEVDSMRLSARNGLHEANQADLHFDRIRKKIHAGATQEELWHEITTIGSYIEETKALMELIQAPPRIKSRSLFVLLHTALDQFRRSHEDLAAYVLIAIGRDIRVRADRDRSIHAFRNIIHNGARAVANAGGGAVIVTAAHYGEEVQIAFEDNGVGMKQAKLEGLRHDRPPDDPAGLGLGFPVAKGFIAEQGGRLETESMEGTGTRVVVALPGAGTEETDDTTEDSYR
jgi:signal transduction histidine kinase